MSDGEKQLNADVINGLEMLRVKFPDNLISKLPKPTKKQTEAVDANYKAGIRCPDCGGWHHPDVIHLDYVGHAALTDRLLDVDINWYWEPLAFADNGLPLFDDTGGLWIKLTVCGMTRLGYGHANKQHWQDAGAREKEVIGDALRNAAMRFGAALDLWHKGDLHQADERESHEKEQAAAPVETISKKQAAAPVESVSKEQAVAIRKALEVADYPEEIFITKCQGGSVESIHANQFESVIKHIQQKGEEYAAAQRTAK